MNYSSKIAFIGLSFCAVLLFVFAIASLFTSTISISVFFLFLSVLFFFVSYFLTQDLLAPGGLFALVGFGCIAFANIPLSLSHQPWSPKLWLTLIIGFSAYFIGSLAAHFISRTHAPPRASTCSRGALQLHEHRLNFVILTLFLVAFSAFAYEAFIAGGLPIFADDKNLAYFLFKQKYVHYFVSLFVVCSGLISVSLCLFRKRISLILLWILSIFCLISILDRGTAMWALIMTLVPYHYLKKPFTFKKGVILFPAYLLIIALLGNFRTSKYADFGINYIAGIHLPQYTTFFTHPYVYFSTSIENLDREIRYADAQGYDYGLHALAPIITFSGFKGRFPMPPDFTTLDDSAFNTPTSLQPFYRDFGLLGVFLGPLFLGFFLGVLHERIRHSKRPILYILVYANFIMPILSIAHFYLMTFPPTYFYVAAFFLSILFAERRPRYSKIKSYSDLPSPPRTAQMSHAPCDRA